MSMPIIKPSGVTRTDAISDIIASVALQQTGLSHILNADGEKIQAVLEIAKTSDELLKVNESVKNMVDSITRLETVLQGKLGLFSNCINLNCDNTIPVLTLSVSDEKAGKIVDDGNGIYTYTGSELENKIIFEVVPNTIITAMSALPMGVTFVNNQLSFPAAFDFSTPYELEFKIGEGTNSYIIKIKTTVI